MATVELFADELQAIIDGLLSATRSAHRASEGRVVARIIMRSGKRLQIGNS
jgi:hypothetical protein